MPIGTSAAIAAALGSGLLAGGAGAAGNILSGKSQAKKEKEMAMRNVTEEGFEDFGGDLAEGMKAQPNLTLLGKKRPFAKRPPLMMS